MTDFGRVGHIKDKDYGGGHTTDCVFMVIGQSPRPDMRMAETGYRMAVVLSGVGYIGRDAVLPGMLGAINLGNDAIEWLDE